ncbi:MAG: glycosyltransferase family 2 protein [Planctomycetota bacterium]
MKLTIVIPCYNEVNTIESVVNTVRHSPAGSREIIVVDDCSTDGTTEILKNKIEKVVDKVIYLGRNHGKGAAIRAGIEAATGDILIIQDADLEYDPAEIPKVIEPIILGKADVVYGSRFAANGQHMVLGYWHTMANKFLTTLSNMFADISLTDMETCYKAFRSNIIKSITIEENRFGIEPEITAKIAKIKCRIYEVSISYSPRSYSQGKKIGFADAISAIRAIVKYNLFYKSPHSQETHDEAHS